MVIEKKRKLNTPKIVCIKNPFTASGLFSATTLYCIKLIKKKLALAKAKTLTKL